MKLTIHKNLDGFPDYIAIMPESPQDKAQLNKISHASNTKVIVQDSSIPDSQFSVTVDIKIIHKY